MNNTFKPVVWRMRPPEAELTYRGILIGDTFRRNKNGSVYIKVARSTFEGNVSNCIMLAASSYSARSAGYSCHTGEDDNIYPATVEVTA